MSKRIISITLALLLVSQLIITAVEPNQAANPVKEAKYSEGAELKYWLTLPAGYGSGPSNKNPLIIYLHGSGERKGDLNNIKVGMPIVYDKIEDFPFVTVSPLCPDDMDWDTLVGSLNILIDETIQSYNIDADRVYLTGTSMGGFGTWEMGMCYPEKFAAIAPIAGGGDPYEVERLKHVPVWAFHGAKDVTVPISYDQEIVDALKAVGGDVTFTVDPEGFHDVWTAAYNSPDLYKWFLGHKKSGQTPPALRSEFKSDFIDLPQMKVAYSRAYGDNCEDNAVKAIREFASSNNIDNNAKYFGTNITQDASGSKRGYEVWVTVDSSVSEANDIKIKDVDGGKYVIASAGSDPENIGRTWKRLDQWLRTSDYKHGLNDGMDGMTFSDNSVIFDMYMSVLPKNDTANIGIWSYDKGYSESGNWRGYGRMRSSASRAKPGDYAQWTPEIKQSGYYKVSMFKPVQAKSDPMAKIEVVYSGGTDTQYLDFTNGVPEWQFLGIYKLDEGSNGYVKVSANTPGTFTRAAYTKFELIDSSKITDFTDISNHWASQTINELTYKGIVSGFADSTFRPESTVAIDEFIKLLVSALGYKLENGTDYWASTYIDKAQELGIVAESEIADYSAPISRLMMAEMLVSLLKGEKYSVTENGLNISDLDSVPAESKDAVINAYVSGMIAGNEDGSFKPDNNMTRAEGATVILRAIKPGSRKKIVSVPSHDVQVEYKDGTIIIPAEIANLDGTRTIRIDDGGNLSYWYHDDAASFEIEIPKTGEYTVEITYSAPDADVGSEIIVEAGGDSLSYKLDVGTGGWGNYKPLKIGTLTLPEGKTTLIMKHGILDHGTFLNMYQMKLIPKS